MMALLFLFFVLSTIYHSIYAIECLKAANCVCPAAEPCLLNCIGTDWCKGGFNLRCASGYPCSLNCDGSQACTDSQLIPNNATSINITCVGSNACSGNAHFKCQAAAPCAITCKNGSNICHTLTVDINGASHFLCSGSNCPVSFPPPFAAPTISPTFDPTKTPTFNPTNPTPQPTFVPTASPTQNPTSAPSSTPTLAPSTMPTSPTSPPSNIPSDAPTLAPSHNPTISPSLSPTFKGETRAPTDSPTSYPVTDGQVIEFSTTLIATTNQTEAVIVNKNSEVSLFTIVIVVSLECVALCVICGFVVLIWREIKGRSMSEGKKELDNSPQPRIDKIEKVNAKHHIVALKQTPLELTEVKNVRPIRQPWPEIHPQQNYLCKAQLETIHNTKGDDDMYLQQPTKGTRITDGDGEGDTDSDHDTNDVILYEMETESNEKMRTNTKQS